MSTTNDPNNPELRELDEDGQQKTYLVLSEEERAKGFVRPVRVSYKHQKCGGVTTMGLQLAETYARDPKFYGATYCATCKTHYPVGENGEFIWVDWNSEEEHKVGT